MFDPKVLNVAKYLDISLDIDGFPEELDKTVPVFLFTPKLMALNTRMPDEEHYHIMLTREKAAELRDWLIDYLGG